MCRRSTTIAYNTLAVVFGIFLVIAVLPIWKQVEPRLFPIVTDFNITEKQYVNKGVLIRGTMQKVRSCTFKSIAVYGYPSDGTDPLLLDYSFNIENSTTNRVEGKQTWGPWTIFIGDIENFDHVKMFSFHKCTSLYSVTTKLTEFKLDAT